LTERKKKEKNGTHAREGTLDRGSIVWKAEGRESSRGRKGKKEVEGRRESLQEKLFNKNKTLVKYRNKGKQSIITEREEKRGNGKGGGNGQTR